MSVVSPRAPLYFSVMTQCWGDGAKRSGDLTQAPPRLTISSLPARRPKTGNFSFRSGLSPRSSAAPVDVCKCATTQTNVRVRTQVRKVPRFSWIFLLVTFLLTFDPVGARPSVHVNLNKVTFRSQLCHPLSEADLQRLLGSASYAENKMAADEAIDKRTFSFDPSSSGYQGDDPQVSSVYGDKGNMQDTGDMDGLAPFDLVEGEELMNRGGMDRKTLDRELMDRNEKVAEEDSMARMPRRKVLNRGFSQAVTDRDYRDTGYDVIRQGDDSLAGMESLQTFSYMRRRRRRSSLHDAKLKSAVKDTKLARNSRQEDREMRGNKFANKSEENDSLWLQLFEAGNDRDKKKYLKKQIRGTTKNSKKPVPWECKMRKDVIVMEDNIYPRTLQTGQCLQGKCFYKLFSCEAIKYSVPVLKLNPIHCNPLPIIGNQTIFEERWEQQHRLITTGCNCVAPRREPSGRGQG